MSDRIHRKYRRAVAAVMLVSCASACATVTWNVPPRDPVLSGPEDITYPYRDVLLPTDPPEAACFKVRFGASAHKSQDTTLGAVLGMLGGAAFATGTAVAAQSGHKPEYIGEWSLLAGTGAALLALGMYFVTRGGDDRQEFWATNAAMAQIRADYEASPTTAEWAKNRTDLEAKVAGLIATRDEKQRKANRASAESQFADAQLLAAQTAQEKGEDADGGAKPRKQTPPPSGAGSAGRVTPPPPGPEPEPDFGDPRFTAAALKTAQAKHTALDEANEALAEATSQLSIAQNELTARQAAWNHCAAALAAIGGVDSAANAALAAGLSSSLGASSSKSSATSNTGSAKSSDAGAAN